jgi:hypothetical protein
MWDIIRSSFEDLTVNLWISQIAGLIGLIVIGISYLFKKKKFIAIATISFIFFIIEQAFAALYSNLIVSSSCFIRNLLMVYFLFKKKKELPKGIVFGLLGVMWISILIYLGFSNTFSKWDNYLPPLIVTMSTITQNNKKEIVVKIGALLHEGGFLVYYLVYHLPLSILRQIILVVACFIGLILIIVQMIKRSTKDQVKDASIEEKEESI